MVDSHTHTVYSFDGEQTVDELCKKSIERGAKRIAITDHYDIDDIKYGFYPDYDVKSAKRDIEEAREKYKGQLEIVLGIELGQGYLFEKEALSFIEENGISFVISSVHNLENIPDFIFMDFSEMPEALIKHLYGQYVEDLIRSAKFPKANVVSHCTYPCRYINRDGRSLDIREYYERYEVLFRIMKERGIALEYNTAGIRKKYGASPTEDILKLYRSVGGELISCGSDAHKPSDGCADVESSLEYLKSLGFKYLTVPSVNGTEQVKL